MIILSFISVIIETISQLCCPVLVAFSVCGFKPYHTEYERQERFIGRIVMIKKGNSLTYGRVKVSKMIDLNQENVLLLTQQFYDDT